MKYPLWNSLEVAKLLTALFTPAAIALVGIYIHRITKRFEHLQWRSQKLVEKRLMIYDQLAPHFNDLLCYFTYVGVWKELDPPTVIALKRTIDKGIHLAAPLFSKKFFEASTAFVELCFETYTGWGRNASLRTVAERRRAARPNDWREEWSECFSASPSDPAEVRKAYRALMEAFASDIGVDDAPDVPLSGRVPGNVR